MDNTYAKGLLYNKSYHSINNQNDNIVSLDFTNPKGWLRVSGVIHQGIFESPGKGTCSNIYYRAKTSSDMDELFSQLSEKLDGYSTCKLVLPSEIYSPNIGILVAKLASNGFTVTAEINNYIKLNEQITFSPGNRRKLKKLAREKFHAFEANSNNLPLVYQILHENRLRKKRNISLPYNKVEQLFQHFPQQFKCWGVVNAHQEWVAAAITVDLTKQARYVLYWGDTIRTDGNSPIVLLASHLISNAQEQQNEYLDLGISSVKGKLDIGLFDFKSSLGANHCLKYSVEK